MNTEQKLIAANRQENRRTLISDLFRQCPQYDVTALEIRGRRIRVSDTHWVTDFASCNYLGFDLDAEIGAGVSKAIEDWGVHPSWCRLVASPKIYVDLEEELARLIGSEAAVILPTVTLISIGVIPALVGKTGCMFLDKSGHETMYEGCKIARDNGATLRSFKQGDLARLEEMLVEHRDNPRKIILVDGVYSMTGDYADIPALQRLAVKHDALVYIDDAHGFGVMGENPTPERPYGLRGNGIVRHFGCDYQNLLYVGGCSKAYSSLAAFAGCSREMQMFIKTMATPYDLSGPCPTASLQTLRQGLTVNKLRGDQCRDVVWRLTQKTVAGLRSLGFTVQNTTGFPIVSIFIGDENRLIESARTLFDNGVLVTVCPYPMMPKGEAVHRITLTAANTDAEVDGLLAAFAKIRLPTNVAG
jgi:8-amino-7-oxononanoate synthase